MESFEIVSVRTKKKDRILSRQLSIDQQNQATIFSELLDHLPDGKFAKPQLDADDVTDFDLSMAMKDTLAAPEYYPPLDQAIFPGDSIAIVLQSDLPHPRQVLAALIEQLGSFDVAVSDIVVVITRPTADRLGINPELYEIVQENRQEGKRPAIFPIEFEFNTINVQVHDPENQAGHSYVVANVEGDPIHLNRMIVDADVVLPVGCPRPGEAAQQGDCLFPDFSTETTLHRFAQGTGSFVSRWQEIELANDSLGAFFSIQIVCGLGDTIRNVFSGARKDAVSSARAATNELWTLHCPTESDVLVATIESSSTDQNWADFVNALVAASRVSKLDGPIVIWSDISTNPDRNIRKACMSQFEDGISAKLPRTLQQVAAIVKDRPVFLRSGLNRNQVEELGLGYVESVAEVLRIAEPHETGLVIRDAHKCQIQTSEGNFSESEQDAEESA